MKTGKRTVAVAVVFAIGFMATQWASAQGPQKINFQGRLVEDGTNLINGVVALKLRVYTNAVGGAALYEDSANVNVVDGLYSTFIGDDTVSGTLVGALSGPKAWVEVEADGDVFAPRYELAAVPYALFAGSAPAPTTFVLKTGDTMTGKLALNLPAVSSPNSAFEQGGGVSVLATASNGAAYAIAMRGRVSQTDASAATRSLRGVGGAANTVGGAGTAVNGGYFVAKIYSSATQGAQSITGVGADAEAEPGATGFSPLQFLFGGRFGAAGRNAGLANAFGVLATAVEPHTGYNQGVLGIARHSSSANIGVSGVANTDDATIAGLPTQGTNGVGVYAYNPIGYAIYAGGPSNRFTGNVSVGGTVTAAAFAGDGAGLTNLPVPPSTNNVLKTGSTMTGPLALNLPAVSSPNSAFEQGGGVSVLATASNGAAYAIAMRGRVSQTDASAATRSVRGASGAVSTVGGAGTTVNGGYFVAKIYSSATQGAQSITGVGADAEAEPGATGFSPLQFLFGGRFGAAGRNAGLANAFGVLATAVEPHTGYNQGVLGIARHSSSANIGVSGVANTDDATIAGLPTQGTNGVGVYAYNPIGYAIYAGGPSNMFTGGVSVGGTVDAGGYSASGTVGITTNLDVTTPGGTATLQFKNGLLTGVVGP